MKQFNKTLLAAALMVAGSATANAAIIANNTDADTAFLVVYDSAFLNSDSSVGVTYNRELGVSFAQLVAAGSNMSLLNTNLSADANWTTLLTGITGSAKWAVVDGSIASHGAFMTGGATAPQANSSDPTALIFDPAATQINLHALEVNAGLSGLSSLVKKLPENFTGQADHSDAGVPFDSLWTGINTGTGFNPLTAFGSTADFYKGSYSFDTTTDFSGFGDFGTNVTLQSDITKVGQLQLTATGLTAAVPLPAAVWLFGAGLMGMLRLNRRKAA